MRASLIFTVSIASVLLAMPASADPPYRFFESAKPPLPEAELKTLTRKLESAASTADWKGAAKAAKATLGDDWCPSTSALDFRTFAALGVVARKTRKRDMAVACALRSYFEATRVERGMVLFELGLLVQQMGVNEFAAFRDRVLTLPDGNCQAGDCCFNVSNFRAVVQTFHPEFYGSRPTREKPQGLPYDDAGIAQNRKLAAKNLMLFAYHYNPSKILAQHILARGWADAETLRKTHGKWIPDVLQVGHVSESADEAQKWIVSDAAKGKRPPDRIELGEPNSRKTGEVEVTQWTVGLVDNDICESEPGVYLHYLVVHRANGPYEVLRDPMSYAQTTVCGGYGDGFGLDEPTIRDGVLMVESRSNFYINSSCGPLTSDSDQQIFCDLGTTTGCLVEQTRSSSAMEASPGPVADGPRFSFKSNKLRIDMSQVPVAMRPLLASLKGASVAETAAKISEIRAKLDAWAGTD